MTLAHVLAGHEGHEVEPVRPDVADRAQRAAAVRLQPPVPVALEEQPVLEIASGHEPDVAEAAVRDELARVLVEGVVPDVEIRRIHEPARLGEADELRRVPGRHREWLLADDVLAGREDLSALAHVQVVGRGDVDHVDRVVRQQLLKGVIGARNAERVDSRLATFRCAAEHPANLDADAPQCLHVDRADEPSPDDRGGDLGDAALAQLDLLRRSPDRCIDGQCRRLLVAGTRCRSCSIL